MVGKDVVEGLRDFAPHAKGDVVTCSWSELDIQAFRGWAAHAWARVARWTTSRARIGKCLCFVLGGVEHL